MLPLLLTGVVFAFLVVGAVVFVFCGLVPPLRKYGLSAALWCAMWGPSSVAWLLFAGLGLVANGFAMRAAQTRRIHLPDLPHNIGTGYAVLGIIGAIFLATIIAWIHQVVIRQMTFALFRIYAGLISAGVGSVWGLCLWIWLVLDSQIPYRVLLLGHRDGWILCSIWLRGFSLGEEFEKRHSHQIWVGFATRIRGDNLKIVRSWM